MITLRYIVLPTAGGEFVRLSKAGKGEAHAQDTLIESSSGEEGPWVPRGHIPPVGKGWVGHTLAVLRLVELLCGSANGFIKGSEEDVKGLTGLLAYLRS